MTSEGPATPTQPPQLERAQAARSAAGAKAEGGRPARRSAKPNPTISPSVTAYRRSDLRFLTASHDNFSPRALTLLPHFPPLFFEPNLNLVGSASVCHGERLRKVCRLQGVIPPSEAMQLYNPQRAAAIKAAVKLKLVSHRCVSQVPMEDRT